MRALEAMFATFVAATLAVAAAAQDHTPAPAATQPALPGNTDPDSPIRATGKIFFRGEQIQLFFYVQGHRAAVILQGSRGDTETKEIQSTNDALGLLVDRRLAFLWPALLEWAGSDLGRLKAFSVADAAANYTAGLVTSVPSSTAESSVRPKTMLLLKYAEALRHAGRIAEASDLLRRARDTMQRRNDWERGEWVMVTNRLASYAAMRKDFDGAIKQLEDAQATFGDDLSYGVNFEVNRAVYLAQAGRFAAALTTIETARVHYDAYAAAEHDGEAVPGSDRQFAWIKACALNGLGRKADAIQALAPALLAEDQNETPFKIETNHQVLARAYMCMGDSDALVRILVAQADALPIGGDALLILEPLAHPQDMSPALLAAVRADPRMKGLADARLHALPPALAPALDDWAPSAP